MASCTFPSPNKRRLAGSFGRKHKIRADRLSITIKNCLRPSHGNKREKRESPRRSLGSGRQSRYKRQSRLRNRSMAAIGSTTQCAAANVFRSLPKIIVAFLCCQCPTRRFFLLFSISETHVPFKNGSRGSM